MALSAFAVERGAAVLLLLGARRPPLSIRHFLPARRSAANPPHSAAAVE